ncbi:unnamed protein product [Allacma fusca]|uniref:Chitin-binding type-2 domain-containing protein n=1 Tax=Allacma fusca TaxID=39272 RepID=A0A8J2J992_9HEXA|nr:unnamed protein product [Allacma fusca]
MVLRLPFVSALWVPLTLLLFAASIGISQTADDSGNSDGANATSKWNKTGNPQIDYLTDPNLPRELNGYNLSDYPFFNRVPTNISFKCDGLKDGFYASIEHKCQLYHHCLFGTRYDFLCANYTAFDQRTFICQFVSDVDCPNSALFFHRNDALYVTKSTTTEAPVRSRDRGSRGRRPIRPALPPPSQKNEDAVESSPRDESGSGTGNSKSLSSNGTKKQKYVEPEDDYYDEPYEEERERPRRPYRRRPWRKRPTRPIYYYPPYDYYDDDYDYEEPVRRPYARRYQDRERGRLDAETDEDPPPRKLGKRRDKERRKQVVDEDYPVDEAPRPKSAASSKSSTTTSTSTTEPPVFDPVVLVKNRDDLFTMSRAPPKIKPPVPLRERTKFHQMQGRIPPEPSSTTTTEAPAPQPSKRRIPTSKPAENEPYDQSYYDEDYEQAQAPAKKSSKYLPFPTTAATTTTTTSTTTTSTTTTTPAPLYEYEYEEYEEEQPQINVEPTTTTTTTTTPRPNSSNRRGRNNRKRQEDQGQSVFPTAADATQENRIPLSSTPGVKQFESNDGIDTTVKNPAFRTAYGSRPRSSFFNKGAFATTATTTLSPTATATTTTTTPKPEVISTYRPKDYRSYVPQRAFIETTTQNSRTSSRFWQRQQPKATSVAVTTTTTTTTAPEAADYVYYDDSVTLSRYGQRSASTYPQYPQTAPEYVADSPEQPEASEEAPTAPPAPDQVLINNYQPAQTQPEAPTSYRNSPGSSRYQVPRAVEQTNYVTPFSTAPSLPKTTAASYLQYQEPHQPQSHRPQSNLQQSQQSQNQPEFISLLPEDEEATYYSQRDNDPGSSHMMSMISPSAQSLQSPQSLPQNRFRNQVTRMFTSPQELYPVYAPAPQFFECRGVMVLKEKNVSDHIDSNHIILDKRH